MFSRRSGLLQQRRHHASAAAAASSSRSGGRSRPAELPPYEPLSSPLNAEALRALAELPRNRDTRKYEQQLTRCATYLRTNVGLINERLDERREALAQRVSRRAESGSQDKSQAERDLEDIVGRLEEDVEALTSQLEAAARQVINLQATLVDDAAAVVAVHTEIAAQQPAPPTARQRVSDSPNDGDGNDDEMLPPVEDQPPAVSARDLLEREREAKTAEYASLSMHERYGRHNDYIAFKRTLHVALNHEVPVPDASTWFGEDGQPSLAAHYSHGGSGDSAGGAAVGGTQPDLDEDEDLIVAREVLSFKCPLTLKRMVEPYTNRLCNHTFEKAAILEFIQANRGRVRCPQTGCNQELTARDFSLDDVMISRIRRADRVAAQEQRDGASSDVDAEDFGSGSQGPSSKRRSMRRGRRRVDEIEDDDD